MANKTETDIITYGDNIFKKAPALSANARQTLVNITPWLALIFGILGLVGSIAGLGVLSFLSPFAAMSGVHGYGMGFFVALLWLVESVLMLMAFPKLQSRSYTGWRYLFWSEVINAVTAIVNISVLGIIGAIIAFWLLYQIKSHYK